MPNRLANEISPYLLQHKDNPVDWYPWGCGGAGEGEGGGQAAAGQHRLLRLPLVPRHGARVVRGPGDRRADERALRQHQGRPRGAPGHRSHLHDRGPGHDAAGRLASERVPDARTASRSTAAPIGRRRTGWACRRSSRCSMRVADAWTTKRRRDRRGKASRFAEHLAQRPRRCRCAGMLEPELARAGRRAPRRQFDPLTRRFRRRAEVSAADGHRVPAPRSRTASTIDDALDMAEATLEQMARGGIYDQIGGGFHRYAVDARWLVPHFEKMLYDNAQLARVYLDAYRVTGEPLYRRSRRARRWTTSLREMTAAAAASTPRRTPTAKAKRASSTSGRRTRSGPRSLRRTPRSSSVLRRPRRVGTSRAHPS